jgi:hypothetical protein
VQLTGVAAVHVMDIHAQWQVTDRAMSLPARDIGAVVTRAKSGFLFQARPQRGHRSRAVPSHCGRADAHGGASLRLGKLTVAAQHQGLTLAFRQ